MQFRRWFAGLLLILWSAIALGQADNVADLSRQAVAAARSGDASTALRLTARAMQLCQQGKQVHPDCGGAAMTRGQMFASNRQYPEAREAFNLAVRYFGIHAPGMPTIVAYVLRRSAAASTHIGDFPAARRDFERALEIERNFLRTPQGNNPTEWWEHAETLDSYGAAQAHRIGDLEVAAVNLRAAANIFRTHPEPGPKRALDTLTTLHGVYTRLGQRERAMETHYAIAEASAVLHGPMARGTLMTWWAILTAHAQARETERARALLDRLVPAIAAEYGEESRGLANWAELYGQVLRGAGEHEQAVIWLRRTRNAWRNQGMGPEQLVDQNENLANAMASAGMVEETIPVIEELVAGLEANGETRSERYVVAIYALGSGRAETGNHEESIQLLLRAFELAGAIPIADRAFHGEIARMLGGVQLLMGANAVAADSFLFALAAARESGDVAALRHVLELLPGTLLPLGRYREALDLSVEYLSLVPETEPEEYATAVQRTAILAARMGDDIQAGVLTERGIELIRRIDGERSERYADMVRLSGDVRLLAGDLRGAERAFTENAVLIWALHGENSVAYATARSRIADLLREVRDHRGYIEQAMPILNFLDGLGDGNIVERVSLLGGIGRAYIAMRDTDAAFPFLVRAWELDSSVRPADHPDLLPTLSSLAWAHHLTGDSESAFRLHGRVVTRTAALHGEGSIAHALRLIDQAAIGFPLLRHAEMDALYERAVAILRRTVGDEAELVGHAYDVWAGHLVARGEHDRALDLYARSLSVLRRHLENRLALLSEREQETWVASTDGVLTQMQGFLLDAAESRPRAAELLYDVALLQKGLRLRDARALRRAIAESGDTALIAALDRLSGLRDRIAQMEMSASDEDRGLVPLLLTEAEGVERNLRELTRARFGESDERTPDWRAVAAALQAGEAAVEFLAVPVSRFDERGIARFGQERRHAAVILVHGAISPRVVELADDATLAALTERTQGEESMQVATLYRALRVAGRETRAPLTRGADVYSAVWAPMERVLGSGVHTVWMAPAGRLHQLAFAALPHPDPAHRLLSDRFRLRQLASTGGVAAARASASARPGSLMLYGGIDYGPGDWDYLEGSLVEAAAIRTLAEGAGVAVNQLSGTTATERTVKALASGSTPGVLHIATHGFFYQDPATGPELAYAMSAVRSRFEVAENPLYRSGLLFAGGNRGWSAERPDTEGDDGVLTAYEVSALRLHDTQLVVLSACETGLGEVRGNEGVFGLQRAFRMAGAGALVMSLWKVPDAETAQFMERFYQAWFDGMTMTDAFDTAQSAMKELFPDDPFRWAAFILVQ